MLSDSNTNYILEDKIHLNRMEMHSEVHLRSHQFYLGMFTYRGRALKSKLKNLYYFMEPKFTKSQRDNIWPTSHLTPQWIQGSGSKAGWHATSLLKTAQANKTTSPEIT